MNYTEYEIEELVEEITGEQFNTFCGMDGCNETILESVREQVKMNVMYQPETVNKGRDEIIRSEQTKLMDLFLGKKHAYESGSHMGSISYLPSTDDDSADVVEILKKRVFDVKPPQSSVVAAQPPPVVVTKPPPARHHQPPKQTYNQVNQLQPDQETTAVVGITNIQDDPMIQYNIKVYKKDVDAWDRIKGLEIRGKEYPTSSDGSCPKCAFKSNVFVILDSLFPAGDLPETLQNLLTQGKAILWSSKQNMKCKEPPTFLCSGNCPFTDISKCGFNIDWNITDLEKIFSGKKNVTNAGKNEGVDEATEEEYDGESYDDDDDDDGEEYDEGFVDIDYYRGAVSWVVLDEFTETKSEIPGEEKVMIRTMFALEQARDDFVNGNMKTLHIQGYNDDGDVTNNAEHQEEVITIDDSSSDETKPASPTVFDIDIYDLDEKDKQTEKRKERKKVTFPVSPDGACPYCRSKDVVYILLKDGTEDPELPELLARLKRDGKAETRIKGAHDWPSFQCRGCTYGFDLDWMKTNLEKIFYPQQKEKQPTKNTTTNNSNVRVTTSQPNVTSTLQTGYLPHANYNNLANPYSMPRIAGPTAAPQLVQGMTGGAPTVAFPPFVPPPMPFVPSFPPMGGMFPPMPGMPPLVGMPPQLASTLMNAIQTVQHNQMTYMQNPAATAAPAASVPTLQWNGQNMWLVPPPPPQAQPAVVSNAVFNSSQATTWTNPANTQYSMGTLNTQITEDSQTGVPLAMDVDASAVHTNVIDLTTDNVQTNDSKDNVEEIKVIDMTSEEENKMIESTTTDFTISNSLSATQGSNIIEIISADENTEIDTTYAEEDKVVGRTPAEENIVIDTTSAEEDMVVDSTPTEEHTVIDMTRSPERAEHLTVSVNSNTAETSVVDTDIEQHVEVPPTEPVNEERTLTEENTEFEAVAIDDSIENNRDRLNEKPVQVIQVDEDTNHIPPNTGSMDQLPSLNESETKDSFSHSSLSVGNQSAIEKQKHSLTVNQSADNTIVPDSVQIITSEENSSSQTNLLSGHEEPLSQTNELTDTSVKDASPNKRYVDVNNVPFVNAEADVTETSHVLSTSPNVRKRTMENSPLNSPVKHVRINDKHSALPTPISEKKNIGLPFTVNSGIELFGSDLLNQDDDSMSIDNSAISSKLLLPNDDATSSGANSPFTDSLFNIVTSEETPPIKSDEKVGVEGEGGEAHATTNTAMAESDKANTPTEPKRGREQSRGKRQKPKNKKLDVSNYF